MRTCTRLPTGRYFITIITIIVYGFIASFRYEYRKFLIGPSVAQSGCGRVGNESAESIPAGKVRVKRPSTVCYVIRTDRRWKLNTARTRHAIRTRRRIRLKRKLRYCKQPLVNIFFFFFVNASARVLLWSCVFNDCFCSVMRRTTKTPMGHAKKQRKRLALDWATITKTIIAVFCLSDLYVERS